MAEKRAPPQGLTPEALQLRSHDIDLPAAVYRPLGSVRRPAVVVGPAGLGRGNHDAYRWAGEGLSAAGYVALVVTFRAATPYDDAADVAIALDWLEKQPQVDSDRLAVFGHSRGGLAVLSAAAEDKRVRSVVSIAAPVDLADYVRAVSGFAPAVRDGVAQFMGGLPEDIPDGYGAVNAIRLASRIHQPVLLIHGTADMRIPPDHSVRLEAALRESKNDRVRLELVEGMGHYLELATLGYQFDRVMALTTGWFAQTLA